MELALKTAQEQIQMHADLNSQQLTASAVDDLRTQKLRFEEEVLGYYLQSLLVKLEKKVLGLVYE